MAHTIPRFIHHPHSPLSVLLPPPTTTPSLFSNHHTPQGHCAHPLPTLLPHTHTWCGWHVPLWLLSRPVCGVCGWHANPITSSTHTATTTVALPITTPPLFGVCVHGNTCHMAMQCITVLVCPTLDASVHNHHCFLCVQVCVAKWCLSITSIPSLPLSMVPRCASSTHTTCTPPLCF